MKITGLLLCLIHERERERETLQTEIPLFSFHREIRRVSNAELLRRR